MHLSIHGMIDDKLLFKTISKVFRSVYYIKTQGPQMSNNLLHIHFSWKDVFSDLESGIKHYLLEVGSKPNFGDIVQSFKTTEDCGVSVQFSDIDSHQGHAYFITVKV